MVLAPAAGQGKKRKTPEGEGRGRQPLANTPKGPGGKGDKNKKGKGKGKDKGKNKQGNAKDEWEKLPASLRVNGACANDSYHGPVCFKLNQNQCWEAAPGGYCPRGAHVCILNYCRGKHAYLTWHGKPANKW